MAKAGESPMMRWSPEKGRYLEERIRENGYPAEKRRMFGHETWFLNGYMFAGANEDGIWLHLGEASVQEALARVPDAAPFVPRRGMVMKDYLLLKPAIHSDPVRLKEWLDRSASYLQGRPPKAAGRK